MLGLGKINTPKKRPELQGQVVQPGVQASWAPPPAAEPVCGSCQAAAPGGAGPAPQADSVAEACPDPETQVAGPGSFREVQLQAWNSASAWAAATLSETLGGATELSPQNCGV